MSAEQIQTGTNFWRLLEVIALRRKMIVSIVVIATIAAVVISLVLPKWYRAEALLLPPKSERVSITSFSAELNDWASMTGDLNLPIMVTPSDLYARILQSRAAFDGVIDSLNLMEYLEAQSRTDAYMILKARADFIVTPEGLIQIRYADRDPQMAAEIANVFIKQLDRINRRTYLERTKQSREFVENSLTNARLDLDSARAQLRRFQERNKTIDLDKQTELAIEAASALKGDLATTEVDLSLKKRTLSESHPDVIELESRVSELKSKIHELEVGGADSSYFALPVAEAPRLTAALADLTTRVKVAERLYENLRVRYDELRLQDNREAPSIAALDWATPPEIRFKPQRSLIVAGTFVGSLVFAILLALFLEYLRRLAYVNPEDFRRAELFFGRAVRSDRDSAD